MKNITNYLKLILVFLALSFVAGLYLFYFEAKNQDYQYNKQWTAVYFINPKKADNLDFAIENYEGEEIQYKYSVYSKEDRLLLEESVLIRPGEKKEIQIKENEKGSTVKVFLKDKELSLKK